MKYVVVWRDGKLQKVVAPPPGVEEERNGVTGYSSTPAGVGPGLDRDIPLPGERIRCYCGVDVLNAREFPEAVRVAYGFPLPHAVYCPKYVNPRHATGCGGPCDGSNEAHLHRSILFEAGKELF